MKKFEYKFEQIPVNEDVIDFLNIQGEEGWQLSTMQENCGFWQFALIREKNDSDSQ